MNTYPYSISSLSCQVQMIQLLSQEMQTKGGYSTLAFDRDSMDVAAQADRTESPGLGHFKGTPFRKKSVIGNDPLRDGSIVAPDVRMFGTARTALDHVTLVESQGRASVEAIPGFYRSTQCVTRSLSPGNFKAHRSLRKS